MQFNSIPFLFYFLPAFLAIYYLTPRRGRSAVLAAASCLYYYLACGRQIWPVAVLLEVTALTFLLGLLLTVTGFMTGFMEEFYSGLY